MSALRYGEPAGREGGPPPLRAPADHAAALERARAQFEPNPDWVYLDTATGGLPPRSSIELMNRVAREWQRGEVDWYAWDRFAESARGNFAWFIGAHSDEIAFIPSISVGVGLVSASLPSSAEVLLPTHEYSSVILPMLVAEGRRGVRVREVPFDDLVDEVRPGTTLVAVSSIQMHTGRAPDLAALTARCEAVGAQLLLDASQAVPFQDLRSVIGRVDYLVSATYKHLLSPRGSSFLYVRRDRWDDLAPYNANWKASDEEAGAFYLGGPLLLRPTAARFDTSPDWLAWVGTAESLRLLREWEADGVLAEVRRLTNRLATGLGLAAPASSLVCLPVAQPDAAMAALQEARIRAALRVGHVRMAPHIWTTDSDVDRAIEVLRPFA
jgi:selenocysteine lyase/cysteine desulfurase